MKKRGFTLIELIVCFALITVVSLTIFKTVLSMQEKQVKNISYNSYLSFVSVLNNTIQNDFLTDTITNVASCGANCFDITYLKKGVVRLEADRENNTIKYGESIEKLPDNYEFYKDISFNNYASVTTSTLDSYYLLRLPIKSDLFPNMDDVKYMHQYSSSVSRENKYILHLDLDGGTIDMNENTLYATGTIIDLPTPSKKNYEFLGWEKISGNSVLSGNTLTIGNSNVTLKAKWKILFLLYSTLILDYSCANSTAGTSPFIMEYGGACEILDDGDGNWRIKLLGDESTHAGTHNLTFNVFTFNVFIDAFLVGGGGTGGGASGTMGGGGGGGYTITERNIKLESIAYEIVVGAANTDTTAFGFTATKGANGVSNGKGGNGGSGGGGPGNTAATSTGGSYGSNGNTGSSAGGTGQGTTTCEFEQSTSGLITDLTGCATGVTAYSGGGAGSAGYFAGIGGIGGGGNYGEEGAANTGGGGGAYSSGAGKAGGTGIVVIRNARELIN